MTAVQSIGYHTPSALPHLVAENILPPDPPSASYTWKTFCTADNEEELLYTSTCVAWSLGKVLRKLFTFDVEQETVQHALLTYFPSPTSAGLSRALVVLLQNQAHIFFLDGASHLVKLNFEVESAFAAPRGIILQRKLPNSSSVHDSQSQSVGKGRVPPQNSFAPHFPTLPIKLNGSKKDYNSLLNFNQLGALLPEDDSMPRHFSLTSPLSEFSLVVRTPSNHHGLWNSRATKSLEALETTEDMIYVSAQDELPNPSNSESSQLLLFVTVDTAKGVFSIWNASYLEAKSASKALTGGSTPTTTVKNRRRSSFVNTGTTTPAARPREKPRESLDAKAKSNTSHTGRRKSKRKEEQSLKEVEEKLASQVDPGYEPRRTARESRRVSSMISRADLNPSFDRSAFQDLATQHAPNFSQSGRRGQSLGNTDRLSFGASSHRRLRASTPGAFSRLSIEDLSELSGLNPVLNASQASTTLDEYEPQADLSTIDEDVGGFDFQAPLDGLNKEVFARKFAEIPLHVASSRSKSFQSLGTYPSYKVFTLLSPVSIDEREPFGRRFFIYIFNPASRECVQVEFSVRAKHSSTNEVDDKFDGAKRIQVLPSFRNVSRYTDIVDILKISDNTQSRVLLLRSGRNGQTYTSVFAPWSPEALYKVPIKRLRLFNPWDISSYLGHDPKIMGVSRSMVVPKQLHHLVHSGPNGSFDIVSTENKFHRLSMKLWPKNKSVSMFMDAIFFILPLSISEKVLTIWWSSYNTLENILQQEWYALAISINCLFLSCEDDKRKRRPRKSSIFPPPDSSSKLMEQLEASWTSTNTDSISAWSWTSKIVAPTTEDRPRSRSSAPVTPSKLRKLYQQREPVAMARELLKSSEIKDVLEALTNHRGILLPLLPKLMAILHILREEMKLDTTSKDLKDAQVDILAPLLAQLGRWLDWSEWDWNSPKYYHYELTAHHDFEDRKFIASYYIILTDDISVAIH
jgi:anaphase-promoting complex subunit 1